MISGCLWAGHVIAAMDLSIGLAPRAARPFYLAAFATAGLRRSLVEPLRAAAARSFVPDLVRLPAFARRRLGP